MFGIGEGYVSRIADSTARKSPPSERVNVSSYKVTKILQELKKYSAQEANKILNRTGQFWHRESYDRLVRDANEFDNIISYILQNPVKAGLVDNHRKWKWNFVNLS